jgi:hypothetical protein
MRRSLYAIISSLSVILDKRVLNKLKYISEAMMTIQGRIEDDIFFVPFIAACKTLSFRLNYFKVYF